MRTTIELPDELLKQAKSSAALSGISLREFFLEAVQLRLVPSKKVRKDPPVVGRPGGKTIEPLTREQIDEAMFG